MSRTRSTIYDTADTMRPYVERAMTDEKLRADVLNAFKIAKSLYAELVGGDTAPVVLATRVATDEDIRERMREAIDDLRSASDRLQGKRDHSGRNTALLLAGIAIGILYNPVTGADTRRFLKDMLTGGGPQEG